MIWQGAVTGGIVAYFNHALHDGGGVKFDEDQQQIVKEVIKKSLGIKKGDTPEQMEIYQVKTYLFLAQVLDYYHPCTPTKTKCCNVPAIIMVYLVSIWLL